MNKTVSIVTIVLILICAGNAQARWLTKYGDALRAARTAKRPVLVVLDNPADPEASLTNVTSTPDDTLKTLLASYELCHIDAKSEHGQKVAKAYKASDEPMTIILDKTTTRIMFKRAGRLSPLELVTALVQNRSGTIAPAVPSYSESFNFDDCYS